MMNLVMSRLLVLALFVAAVHAAPGQTAKAAPVKAAQAAATANLLDINTATPSELKSLKGIGDAYAKRIIDRRPYTAKNQLTTRGVLPQTTYDGIKDQIIAHIVK